MTKVNLDNKTIKRILLGLFVITVITFAFLMIKDTHAYYNYETGPVPIFTSKVGNFAGKGDTSPLDRSSDINVLYLIQDVTNPKNYTIMENTPALVSGYIINDKKSNCIPANGIYTMYEDKVYSIAEDGTVTVKVAQDKPNQVVCRIYYDYGKTLDDDIIVFALKEDDLGMVMYNGKHYTMADEIPSSGFTYDSSSCKNTEIATEIGYDASKGFTFKTDGTNLCYAYFNKAS